MELSIEEFKEQLKLVSPFEFYQSLAEGCFLKDTFHSMYLGVEYLDESEIRERLKNEIYNNILVFEGDVCLTEDLYLNSLSECKGEDSNTIIIQGNFTVKGCLEIIETGYFYVDGNLETEILIYGEDYVFINGDIIVNKVAYIGDQNSCLDTSGSLNTPYLLFVADSGDISTIRQGINKDTIAIVGENSYGSMGDIASLEQHNLKNIYTTEEAMTKSGYQGEIDNIYDLIDLIAEGEFSIQ